MMVAVKTLMLAPKIALNNVLDLLDLYRIAKRRYCVIWIHVHIHAGYLVAVLSQSLVTRYCILNSISF